MEEPAGRATIQRFVLIEMIGRGGMGTVYRAHDPQLERDVALKVLAAGAAPPPELVPHTTLDLRRPGPPVRDDLIREARLMAQLSHPNVLPVYEVGLDGGAVFLVMEYIAGANLRDWLGGAPGGAAIREAFAQAADGLAAAHARGIIHRDFKPENVLVGADGRVRVADFGLSRIAPRTAAAVSGSMVRVAEAHGTPAYMAPELWRGEPATAEADVYAFCTALAEALLGGLPAEGADVGPALGARGVEPALAAAIRDGLAADPAARPGLAAVAAVLRAPAPGPGQPQPTPAIARPRHRASRRWLVGVGLAVIVGVTGALVLGGGDEADACTGDPEILVGRWDAARRAKLVAALERGAGARSPQDGAGPPPPDAAETIQRVIASLDEFAAELVAARSATCVAVARGELSPVDAAIRTGCLDRRAFELGAVVGRLVSPKLAAGAAEERAQALSSVASCNTMLLSPIRDRAATEALQVRLADIGELPAAERAARYAALEREAAALGEAEVEARAAISLGIRLRDADQPRAGDEVLQRAYRRALDIRADSLAAIALLERANLASSSNDAASARSLSELALAIAERPTTPPRTRVRTYAALARADNARGDHAAAIEKLRTGLALIAQHRLKMTTATMSMRFTMSTALNGIAGRTQEAIAFAHETVDFAAKHLGERAGDYGVALNHLAIAYRLADNLDASIPYRRRALAVMSAALPASHSRVVLQRADLAADLQAAGNYAEARREFAAALAQTEHNQGLRANRASLLNGLAVATWGIGQHTEGVQLLEQAITELTSQHGHDHPRTLLGVRALVDMELDLGRLDSAARHIAALERGYRDRPTPNDIRAVTLRGTHAASLAIARGDPRTAEALTRGALAELAERKLDDRRVEILATLGASLVAQRRWADAIRVLEETLAMRNLRAMRADRSAVVELWMAQAEYGLGRRAAAIERAQRIRPALEAAANQPRARASLAAFLAKAGVR